MAIKDSINDEYHKQFSYYTSSYEDNYDCSSLNFLHTGTSEKFISALIKEINNHPAVNHPYLIKLSKGLFPNPDEAIKDYAHQYSFYSLWFVRYLKGVIKSMPSKRLELELIENIKEEEGDENAIELKKRPHVEIFQHFKKSIGVDEIYIAKNPPSTTAILWRNLFLQKCDSDILGVGIGAIGLATEFIVPRIYTYITKSIENQSNFPDSSSLFFRLHIDCDQAHAQKIIDITTEIAENIASREAIRFGVISALNLRNAFWDSQHSRALLKTK